VHDGDGTAAAAKNAVDLMHHVDEFGYSRYWVTEHHFDPGIVSTSPIALLGACAASRPRLRLGVAALQLGHRTPLSVVEDMSFVAALAGSGVDIGLGRSAGRFGPDWTESPRPQRNERLVCSRTARGGDLFPPRGPSLTTDAVEEAWEGGTALLHEGMVSEPLDFSERVSRVEDLLRATPMSGTQPESRDSSVFVVGATGGASARTAARLGLPFIVGHHHSPSAVPDAVDRYRDEFIASDRLRAPQVFVTAMVFANADGRKARARMASYADWVRSTRLGTGTMPYPRTGSSALTREEREQVSDRTSTLLCGSPVEVGDRLSQLVDVVGADEVLLATVAPTHIDRLRSYEVLADVLATDNTSSM
jgi:alkanesulfonate monooxygenase SsuD/methylene tetrahydromethanopterin reductase-like flavin-dependent oxidoreductase (luciferase family)